METLNKIASLELKQSKTESQTGAIDLADTLDDLRIVLEPFCEDAGIEVLWRVPDEIPPVWADRHSLLQVLLNLTKNSQRALEGAGVKRIEISVSAVDRVVSIRVGDTGPGIGSTTNLFQPFQKGADSTGLGLYLSRAFMRSFHGELRHEPSAAGCSFAIDLAAAGPSEPSAGIGQTWKRIRLLLLDDHILFRESLSRLLVSEPDFEMAGHCGTAGRSVEFSRALRSTSCCLTSTSGTITAANSLRRPAPLDYKVSS